MSELKVLRDKTGPEETIVVTVEALEIEQI
jgi:hypothetical protein